MLFQFNVNIKIRKALSPRFQSYDKERQGE